MNVFTRTLAGICFAVVPVLASPAHAGYKRLSMTQAIVSCRDLSCFGQLAVSEKLGDGSIASPIELYDKTECQEFDNSIIPGACKVIVKPRFAYKAMAWVLSGDKRSYEGCHDYACFGTVFIGELYYDRGIINAVALANKAECDSINAAAEPDVQVPCFRLDSIPPHFTQEEVENSLR